LFDPKLLKELRDYYSENEAKQADLLLSEREVKALSIGATADALRMDPRWFDVWRDPNYRILEHLGAYTWVIFPPQVRHIREIPHLVPWHQDAGYQKLIELGGHEKLITCWIPFDDEPRHHSTLQFCRDELPELEHQAFGSHGAGIELPNCMNVEHWALDLGDCLFFGHLAAHRTYVPPGAVVERHSFEFRLVRPNDAIDRKDYFDIKSGVFVRTDGSTRSRP
jgi:hypothetical protein